MVDHYAFVFLQHDLFEHCLILNSCKTDYISRSVIFINIFSSVVIELLTKQNHISKDIQHLKNQKLRVYAKRVSTVLGNSYFLQW